MGEVLVTGGAGFVGSNLVNRLLDEGKSVVVLDSLARKGTERNLEWLRTRKLASRLRFIHADVRDFDAVREGAKEADQIYHLAAQVAVTTSVLDPRTDFEVNALGTFNVLEAARLAGRKAAIVFTSTNKVYGECEDVPVVETAERWQYAERPLGITESQPLDFHSPYGCSKGAADQYIRDYARIYDLRTVVFRMSCIYGPRQFGNEDQGWIAHFLIAALLNRSISIYGDGKQVRDILFVDDLVRAFRLAVEKIHVTKGNIYNIGGGPTNTLAVWTELGKMLGELRGQPMPASFHPWRPGDQRVYVSDIRKAAADMGWTPAIDKGDGVRMLWEWIKSNRELFERAETEAETETVTEQCA